MTMNMGFTIGNDDDDDDDDGDSNCQFANKHVAFKKTTKARVVIIRSTGQHAHTQTYTN